jgi:L-threonylcarbamoyladenylate synthase
MVDIIPARDPECAPYAAELLRAGELVVVPTDTVYGLAAAASNEAAVRRLYAVKGRSLDKPLPLLIANTVEASAIGEVTPVAQQLMSRFWPGGLTIVLRRQPGFRSLALAKQETVALRVPDHELVRDIIRLLGEPVTGTSANRSGARAPVSAAEAALGLGDLVALVIDGGRAPGGVESTVVDVSQGGPRLVREGAVAREELEAALGRALRDVRE